MVNLFSTLTNFLLFYLILNHSKKEKKSSRVVNFLQNLFLYLGQFHWGNAGVVNLLPFPGIFCNGFYSNFFDTLWLGVFWTFYFCLFALMMFLVILIRLKAIARSRELFDWKDSTYLIITIILCFSTLIPVPFAWFSAHRTMDQMTNTVLVYFPNCLKALDITGILIFTEVIVLKGLLIAATASISIGGFIYLFFCGAIIFEIKQQGASMSAKHLKYHVKLLKDTIVQNVFRFIVLVIPPIIMFKNAFSDPADDTITGSIVANVGFVGAPIPCAIVICYQNTIYRQFLKSKILYWKRKDTFVRVSSVT